MSMGLFASVVVGWLIDEIGLEICTAMTLVLGQLQMILLLLFGDNRNFLVASFWVYTMFRQFLYPVYIASLTSNLGFKYFGVLLGIGFAVAGCAQLLQTPLLELVKGDCHAFETSTDEFESGYECGSGYWRVLHFLQFSVLGCLLLVPVQDYRYKILRESTIKEILSKQPVSCSYGTNLYGTNL